LTVHTDPHLSNLISKNQHISIAPIFSENISILVKLTVGYAGDVLHLITSYLDIDLGNEVNLYLTYFKYNVYEDL
jgi:hypothetical protein